MTYTKCPNCNKSLTGIFNGRLLEQSRTDFINSQLGQNKEGYCTVCSSDLLSKIGKSLRSQKEEIEKRLRNIIHNIPIMTSPAPIYWTYEVIGMVTAQTTSGTDFMTELSRSFNDMLGSTSNTSNRKIAIATNSCKVDIIAQCVRLGGNAVISTDIDFSEIGSGSTNMLMVCMAGTAIRVTEMTNINANRKEAIQEVIDLTQKLEALAQVHT